MERLILVVQAHLEQMQSIVELLSSGPVQHQVVAIAKGQEALDFLYQRGQYVGAPHPDFMLLDWDLPDISGLDILAQLKADSQLRRIPVIMLTPSAEPSDILHCYRQQGNCYVVHPDNPAQLSQIVQNIEAFWCGLVTLPWR